MQNSVGCQWRNIKKLVLLGKDEQIRTDELGFGLNFPKSSVWREHEPNTVCVGFSSHVMTSRDVTMSWDMTTEACDWL